MRSTYWGVLHIRRYAPPYSSRNSYYKPYAFEALTVGKAYRFFLRLIVKN